MNKMKFVTLKRPLYAVVLKDGSILSGLSKMPAVFFSRIEAKTFMKGFGVESEKRYVSEEGYTTIEGYIAKIERVSR